MAGPHAQQSPCWNSPPTGEDELARDAPGAPTNDSGTPSHTLAVWRIPTPALAPLSAPAELVAKYTNVNLQRASKLALELCI